MTDIELPGRFVNREDHVDYPWQKEGVAFGVRCKRVLYPLPTGSGKTFIVLKHAHERGCYKNIVLCRGSSLYVWYKNILLHLPDLAKHTAVIGKLPADKRQRIYNDPNIHTIVMKVKTYTYDHKLIKMARPSWHMAIMDECHHFMRKHKTKQYEILDELFQRCTDIAWASANPSSKGRQEIWPLLHSARPLLFKSYWNFVNAFCITNRGPFGFQILGPKETEKYKKAVAPVVYQPSMPITGIPKITRSTIPIELSGPVRKMYDNLLKEMYVELSDGKVLISSTVLAKVTRLRQLLCCPAILDPALGLGDGIETILEHMEEDEERLHCAIFVPFTDALPYFEAYLKSRGFDSVVTFRGGMSLNELQVAEEQFRSDPNCVSLCSVKFAESFELETGFPAYFCGYDWDPYVNAQGEGRLARLTTKRDFIPSFYIHHMNTYDDRLLEVCGNKISNTKIDMVNIGELKKLFEP